MPVKTLPANEKQKLKEKYQKQEAEKIVEANRKLLKTRFKNKLATASSAADVLKLVKILSRHVFGEEDGE
jgi:hypothetical protein